MGVLSKEKVDVEADLCMSERELEDFGELPPEPEANLLSTRRPFKASGKEGFRQDKGSLQEYMAVKSQVSVFQLYMISPLTCSCNIKLWDFNLSELP